MKNTIDRLADADHRDITTTFLTDIRVEEGTYDSGTVRVALTTSHNKARKRFETRLNREVLTDSGFVTRRITMFQPSADAGITLAAEPTARFNANKARVLHQYALDYLDTLLSYDRSDVAPVLAGLLDNARTNA